VRVLPILVPGSVGAGAGPGAAADRGANGRHHPQRHQPTQVQEARALQGKSVCPPGISLDVTSQAPDPKSCRCVLRVQHLLPSLVVTAEPGFRYLVVIGYDAGDAFYDTDNGRAQLQEWFQVSHRRSNSNQPKPPRGAGPPICGVACAWQARVATKLAAAGISMGLELVRVSNEVKKPGPVFLSVARAAQPAGATYLYRVNDDTQCLHPWATTFVHALQASRSTNHTPTRR
jgi:hypothetical protein